MSERETPERVVTSPNGERHINPRYVEWLESESVELRQALKEEMAWDMGGVPESRWKSCAEDATDALDDIASGDWQRYPNRERHGQTPVQEFARWASARARADVGART